MMSLRTQQDAPEFEIENVVVRFMVGRKQALDAVAGVSATIPSGSAVGLIGESGSGKSTLARALTGLVPIHSGAIRWRGKDISKFNSAEAREFRSKVQMIFQDPHSALNPRQRIIDSVIEPLRIIGDGSKKDWVATAEALMDRVGLRPEHGSRYPHELSGGQKQRVCIARALVTNPRVLICDESVAALDVALQAEVLNLLNELKAEYNLTLVFISHDLSVVSYISETAYVMYLGKIMEFARIDELEARPRHPYSASLLAAQMTVDLDSNLLATPELAKGDIPSPLTPPSGCRFNTRCIYASDRCKEVIPPIEATNGESYVACHYWRDLALNVRGELQA